MDKDQCVHEGLARNYPGLDFKFKIDDLPKEYLDRLGRSMAACHRITGLVDKHKISRRQAIHLTMWSDPISTVWLDRNADEALKQKYRFIKGQNVLALYNEVSAIADAGEQIPFTIDDTFKYHQKLLSNIPQDPARPSGHYRKGEMTVTKQGVKIAVGTCCQDVPAYMERLFAWLDSSAFESNQGSAMGNAFIKAIVAHLYFVSIHPFYDGNGSTARLLQYSILRNAGVSAQIAHLLANYYNETRQEYIEASNAARLSGDVTIFLDYALQGLSLKLNAYLRELLKNFPDVIREQVKEKEYALAKGFTILEILVVLAVLAILIGMAVPRIKGMQDQGGMTRAKSELRTVQAAVESYKINTGSYPSGTSMDGLVTASPQLVTYENLQDPWGGAGVRNHSYQLMNPGNDTQYYLIQSRGPILINNGNSCYIQLDSPTGTPNQPDGCQCLFVTNAPVASMTLATR
jgi:type II secretion system protein G